MQECVGCKHIDEEDFPDHHPLVGTTYCLNWCVRDKVSELFGEPLPDHAVPSCELVYKAHGGLCPYYTNKP